MNDDGVIAGYFSPTEPYNQPCILSPNGFSSLPLPVEQLEGLASGISNNGTVIGYSGGASTPYRGVVWVNGGALTINLPAPWDYADFTKTISQSGIIVAHTERWDGTWIGGDFIVSGGVPHFFAALNPADTRYVGIQGINNSGWAVGNSNDHAMLWPSPESPYDLNAPYGGTGTAIAINNLGFSVGWMQPANAVKPHAFIANPAGLVTLLPDDGSSTAFGINDSGEVFGRCYGTSGNDDTPTIWRNGNKLLLNDPKNLIGYQNGHITLEAINNRGSVVAWGTLNGISGTYLIEKDGFTGPGYLGHTIAHTQPRDEIADPVSATTGAFDHKCVDLHVNGPLPIEIRRSYSSLNYAAQNEFGYGWLPGYSSYLIPAADGSTIQAADIDGSVVTFRQQTGSTTIWSLTPDDAPNLTNSAGGQLNLFASTVVKSTSGGTVTYQWNLADGSSRTYTVLTFPVTISGVTYNRVRPFLTAITDNRGNSLSFSYGTSSTANDYGQMSKIQSSNGTSVTLTYDSLGHIAQATASDGRTVGYSYSNDNLEQVVLSHGAVFQYQYVQFGHLLAQVTKPGNQILKNIYDDRGRVIQQFATVDQANPTSLVLNATFDYNSVSNQTTIRDAYNNPTVYQYTSGGLITNITDPLGQSISQVWYNDTNSATGAYANSLQSITDQRGLVTTYKYDAQGNTVETKITGDLDGDQSTTESATTTAVYNSRNLPTTVTDASGIITTFSYTDSNYLYLPTQIVTSKNNTTLRTDKLEYTAQTGSAFSKGLLSRKTVALGSPDQAVTEYAYSPAGFMTQQTSYTGTSDPNVVTTFAYNARGELTTATDADGRSTTYTYDGMSRPLTRVVKDETGSTLGSWTMTYTGNGELSQTTGPRSAPANSTQRTYDGAGRLMEEDVARSLAKADGSGVTTAPVAATDYVHDFFGNLVLMIDPLGNETTMSYDAIGQLRTKATANLRTESFQYEPGGKVSRYTNPLGGVTNSYYTATGQLRRQENPDGSVLESRYYTDGRLQKQILRNGSYWTTVYNDIAHTITRTLASASGTVLATEVSTYDLRGNLVSHTDPEGFTKTVTYDGLNRVKTTTGPAATSSSAQQITTTIYGASAKTVRTQNALGEQSVTTSDALGRPTLTQVIAAGGAVVHTTSYAYSADHNSVTVTEGTGAGAISRLTWTDTLDRPVLTVLGDGSFTRNTYDLDGNLLFATDALGQTTGYTYNALNQLIAQALPDGTVTAFTYDTAGDLLTRAMANGTLTHEQTYDNAGRKLTERLYSGSTTTRQYAYSYYPVGSSAPGLLATVTGGRSTATTAYDDFLRPQSVTTSGSAPEVNGTISYAYDRRGLVLSVTQTSVSGAAGPDTQVSRSFDGYGQILTEIVTVGGSTYSGVMQTWDAAGRRASLSDAYSTLPAPLFAYQHRADGLLAQVAVNNQNYNFAYADSGLITSRTNPFRSLSVNTRDAVGRILDQTQVVSGTSVLVEDMFWRANSTLSSYTATRTGTGVWNETRLYSYSNRDQLLSEGFSPAANVTSALNYVFDGNSPGLGVRLDAKIGTGAPASWERSATVDALGRVTSDNQMNAAGRAVPAGGNASGADHVDIMIDGVAQGRAFYTGSAWSFNLNLAAGMHTLTANAVDPSGLYTASAGSTFTVTGANSSEQTGIATSGYDADGNVISCTLGNGTVQALTWDAFGRLIKVSQRDSSGNGYDWSAVYDGLGRRLQSAQHSVLANNLNGAPVTIGSLYDPQVEFLEIGVSMNGARAYKVYGPDLNGRYGGLQGTGGLEATILDADGTTQGVINDQFGNAVASVSAGVPTWFAPKVGGYGPLPGSSAKILTDIADVAEASIWRGHRIDPTGFYNLGARYYEPTSGRFLSPDPMGHGASMSLYDFTNGDPVNRFDPDGRLATGFKDGKNGRINAGDPDSWAFKLGLILGGVFQGGVEGATGGSAIVLDTATFHQINDLHLFAENLQGDVYDFSRASATIGVGSGYAVAVLATGGAILEASPSLYVSTATITNSSLVLTAGGVTVATNQVASSTVTYEPGVQQTAVNMLAGILKGDSAGVKDSLTALAGAGGDVGRTAVIQISTLAQNTLASGNLTAQQAAALQQLNALANLSLNSTRP